MSNVLVITSNPEPSSMTNATGEAFAEGAGAQGARTELIDLYGIGFDPVYTAADRAHYLGRGPMPEDVAALQARLAEADVIAIVFPVYWYTMPAMVKGLFDRVICRDFAYHADGRPGALAGKTVRVILLTGGSREWYEVSNWARPGYESRHNLGYWRNVDWAGLGPGAHSHYNAVAEKGDGDDADHPQSAAPTAPAGGGGDGLSRGGDHGTHGLRGWDIAHPRLWGVAINEGRVPWSGSESITAEENLEEIIMLGLRIREGLDLDRVNRLIRDGREAGTLGPSITALDRTRFEPLVDEGLVTLDGDRVVPTRAGRLLNDTIIERCFAWCGL